MPPPRAPAQSYRVGVGVGVGVRVRVRVVGSGLGLGLGLPPPAARPPPLACCRSVGHRGGARGQGHVAGAERCVWPVPRDATHRIGQPCARLHDVRGGRAVQSDGTLPAPRQLNGLRGGITVRVAERAGGNALRHVVACALVHVTMDRHEV
eukprot:scaffold9901_cov65-Phaeocystis_antarctica.AAC.1